MIAIDKPGQGAKKVQIQCTLQFIYGLQSEICTSFQDYRNILLRTPHLLCQLLLGYTQLLHPAMDLHCNCSRVTEPARVLFNKSNLLQEFFIPRCSYFMTF